MPDGSAIPSSFDMSGEGETQTLSVVSNSEWKVTIEDGVDWLTITPQQGNKDSEIKISVSKNTNESKREAVFFFSVGDRENFKKYTISQEPYGATLSVSPESVDILSDKGEDITFTVNTNNYNWDYSIPGEANWLKEKEKTSTSLTLTADLNSDKERSASITFKLTTDPSITKVIKITQAEKTTLVADMLDVEFNLDGSAKDLSPMKHTVQKIEYDYPFTVTFSETYKRNIVTFNPEQNGTSQPANKGSYYRIDYETGSEFQQKLTDGHSFETLVKFDVDYSVEQRYETKFFSAHERGGTGFLIARGGHTSGSNGLTFLPNVSAEGGSSNWIWANSNVQPDGKSWYHLVGVWDKDAGKAYLYVNGEKKAEVDAVGYYMPIQLEQPWVALGGDPGKDIIQAPFAGSMAIARIYDKALTEAEAEFLWNEVK